MSTPETKDPAWEHLEKAARLGPGLFFQGELSGKEDFVVQGHVRGKINLPESDILVTDRGKVEAEVQVRNITVKGEVNGDIHASGKVLIEKTGRMNGNLSASLISIEDGAQFKGTVKVLSKK